MLVLLLMISIAAVGASVPYSLQQTTNLLIEDSGEQNAPGVPGAWVLLGSQFTESVISSH